MAGVARVQRGSVPIEAYQMCGAPLRRTDTYSKVTIKNGDMLESFGLQFLEYLGFMNALLRARLFIRTAF